MTAMPVPEAAMDKYDSAIPGKNNIRFSGKILAMKPETESGAMQGLTDGYLRAGIFPPDAGHHPAPGGAIDNIGHVPATNIPLPPLISESALMHGFFVW